MAPQLFRRKRAPPSAGREAAIAMFGTSAFNYGDDDTLSPEESSALDSDAWLSAYTPPSGSYPTSSKFVAESARQVIESYNPADPLSQPRPQRAQPQDAANPRRFMSLKRMSSTFTLQHGNLSLGELLASAVSIDELRKPSVGRVLSRQPSTTSLAGPSSSTSSSSASSSASASASSSRVAPDLTQPATTADDHHPSDYQQRRHNSEISSSSAQIPSSQSLHFAHQFATPSLRSYQRDSNTNNGFARQPLPQPKPRYFAPELRPTKSVLVGPVQLPPPAVGRPKNSPSPVSSGSFKSNNSTASHQPQRGQIQRTPGVRETLSTRAQSMPLPSSAKEESASSSRSSLESSAQSSSSSSSYVDAPPAAGAKAAAAAAPSSDVATSMSSRTAGSGSEISPASSMIFERQVQQDAASTSAGSSCGAIPTHHHSSNLIPPVLTASCEVLTNEQTDPDQVEVVSVSRSSLHRSNSNASLTSMGSIALSMQPVSPTASVKNYSTPNNYTTNDSNEENMINSNDNSSPTVQHRLSFYSFVDVINSDCSPGLSSSPSSPTVDSSKSTKSVVDSTIEDSSLRTPSSPVVMVTTLGEAIRRKQDEIITSL
ncbi:hypothetical protein BZA70DRAFT_80287 [Myxozyma melibiosi]|uniref:Uncharacterized protein n=1 Tax=Myxozyma melibiosi TaxID=54550 RepID=A0ABR1EZN7_9ASCO